MRSLRRPPTLVFTCAWFRKRGEEKGGRALPFLCLLRSSRCVPPHCCVPVLPLPYIAWLRLPLFVAGALPTATRLRFAASAGAPERTHTRAFLRVCAHAPCAVCAAVAAFFLHTARYHCCLTLDAILLVLPRTPAEVVAFIRPNG